MIIGTPIFAGQPGDGSAQYDLIRKVINANGLYFPADDGVQGYSRVDVNVPIPTMTTKVISENGTYLPADDGVGGYTEIVVSVPQTIITGTCAKAFMETSAYLDESYSDMEHSTLVVKLA